MGKGWTRQKPVAIVKGSSAKVFHYHVCQWWEPGGGGGGSESLKREN